MPVVRESLRNAQPAHDDERDVIDDTGLGCLAAIEGGPGNFDLLRRRRDQESLLNQLLPKHVYPLPERPASGGVAALPKYQGRCQHLLAPLNYILVGRIRRCVPLVRTVPHREQPNRVEKNRTSWLVLVVSLGGIGLSRMVSLSKNRIDLRQPRANRGLTRFCGLDELQLQFDCLPLGHAGVFVEFDGPAVDLAVQCFSHGYCSFSVIVARRRRIASLQMLFPQHQQTLQSRFDVALGIHQSRVRKLVW